MIRIGNISLMTESGLVSDAVIETDGARIVYAGPRSGCPPTSAEEWDGGGLTALPGFVDIHQHGGGGIEYMSSSPEEIRKGCLCHALHGTTTMLPTSFAANEDLTLQMIRSVREASRAEKRFSIAGIHLEGPFLSPAQSGAQSPDALAVPSPERWEPLLNEWPEGIRIMGAAPELPGALELGAELKRRGITASIAHSDADWEQCCAALKAGYTDITHIYSGCSMVHRIGGFRHGGVVEAGLLEDGFTVQVIADGCHLPPELLKLIVKNKGPQKTALITDALFAAGVDYPEGTVVRQANGMECVLEDGVMKMPDRKAFAGSIATMDRLVKNMVELAGVSLCDASVMASQTPARIVGLSSKGRLAEGADADIVLMDDKLQVRAVWALGRLLRAPS